MQIVGLSHIHGYLASEHWVWELDITLCFQIGIDAASLIAILDSRFFLFSLPLLHPPLRLLFAKCRFAIAFQSRAVDVVEMQENVDGIPSRVVQQASGRYLSSRGPCRRHGAGMVGNSKMVGWRARGQASPVQADMRMSSSGISQRTLVGLDAVGVRGRRC